MKVKVIPSPTFEADVAITQTDLPEPQPVKFTFKHKTKTDLVDFFNRVQAAKEAKEDLPLVAEVVVGWDLEEAFSEAALGEFLENHIPASVEIINGYRAALADARAKN